MIFLFTLLIFTFSCKEETFPENLYAYQVTRLLTGGSQKTWIMDQWSYNGTAQTANSCTDSLFLVFTDSLVSNQPATYIRQVKPLCQMSGHDTVAIGLAYAASYALFFQDSLVFSADKYWIIDEITSQYLQFHHVDSGTETSFHFHPF